MLVLRRFTTLPKKNDRPGSSKWKKSLIYLCLICLDATEAFLPEQFDRPPIKTPWKAILYAVILFLLGSLLLTIGLLTG
jgi:hypothetical protein